MKKEKVGAVAALITISCFVLGIGWFGDLFHPQKWKVVRLIVSLVPKVSKKTMPNLSGKSLEEAKVLLAQEELIIGEVIKIPSDSLGAGLVLMQAPQPGFKVARGDTVKLGVTVRRFSSENTSVLSARAREEWKTKYFKPVTAGSYNVFVISLNSEYDFESACSVKATFSNKYPNFYFRVMHTVAVDGVSNQRYVICLGNGLTMEEADFVVNVAKREGIASDAYKSEQSWDTNDSGLDDSPSPQETQSEQ